MAHTLAMGLVDTLSWFCRASNTEDVLDMSIFASERPGPPGERGACGTCGGPACMCPNADIDTKPTRGLGGPRGVVRVAVAPPSEFGEAGWFSERALHTRGTAQHSTARSVPCRTKHAHCVQCWRWRW